MTTEKQLNIFLSNKYSQSFLHYYFGTVFWNIIHTYVVIKYNLKGKGVPKGNGVHKKAYESVHRGEGLFKECTYTHVIYTGQGIIKHPK